MPTLVEIQSSLQSALTASTKAQSDYDAALQKLEPLRTAALEKQREVNRLIADFQKATNVDVPTKGKRAGRAKYTTTPETLVSALYKRTLTRLTNSGSTESEAKKQAKIKSEALAKKLGVSK